MHEWEKERLFHCFEDDFVLQGMDFPLETVAGVFRAKQTKHKLLTVVVCFSDCFRLTHELSHEHFSWRADCNSNVSILRGWINEFASNLIRRAATPQPVLM